MQVWQFFARSSAKKERTFGTNFPIDFKRENLLLTFPPPPRLCFSESRRRKEASLFPSPFCNQNMKEEKREEEGDFNAGSDQRKETEKGGGAAGLISAQV